MTDSRQMAYEVIHEAIYEALGKIEWCRPEREYRYHYRGAQDTHCTGLDLSSNFSRSDGIVRRSVFCILRWNARGTVHLYEPEQRSGGHPGQDVPVVSLTNPDWEKSFEEKLQIVRQRAADNKGRGGKKKYLKNRLKWSPCA